MVGSDRDETAPTLESLQARGLSHEQAELLLVELSAALRLDDPLAAWRHISKQVLRPELPFELHRLAHRLAFAQWDEARGPAPGWVPSDEEIDASNLGQIMAGDYPALHRRSVEQPEAHWAQMLSKLRIVADPSPQQILDASDGADRARWLVGARLNIARSALERDPERTAVVWQQEGGAIERRTLGELKRDCARVGRGLTAAGYGPGDAIAIDMPMTYESVVIYLAVVSIGGAVVSIADSFAAEEIATRLRIAQAKGIFTQDVILRGGKTLPLYDRVVAADAPAAVVLTAGAELAVELRPAIDAGTTFCRRPVAGPINPTTS